MVRFDREVADAVARYRKQVGRELTPEEAREGQQIAGGELYGGAPTGRPATEKGTR